MAPRGFLVVSLLLVLAGATPPSAAAVRSPEKPTASPQPGKSLAYFIREASFMGSARTMFLYADDAFLGTVENDAYIAVPVEPGERLLWMNWARISRTFRFEEGKTYWFAVATDRIENVPEEDGRRRLGLVASSCTPEPKEVETAARQIAERRGKAREHAGKESEYLGTKSTRDLHIAKWPPLDLTAYPVLVLEDARVTDPKAGDRSRQDLVIAAPKRFPERVRDDLAPEAFEEVIRGALAEPRRGTVILRVEFPQYKPGSEAARMMMAGAGAARLDFTARVLDGFDGRELATVSDERAFGWGGMMGAAGGIDTIERNLAFELATWLERGRGWTGTEEP